MLDLNLSSIWNYFIVRFEESNLVLFQIFTEFSRTLSESQFVLSAFSVGIEKVLSGKLLGMTVLELERQSQTDSR